MNYKTEIVFLLFLMPIFLFGQESICPDVDGYAEHPILKKYLNSCVIGYNITKYEKAILPVEKQTSRIETKHLTVEGKITDILFDIENKDKATVLEVQRNYEAALKNSKMNIIYSCSGKEDCFKYGNGNFVSKTPSMGDVKYVKGWEHQKLKFFRFAMSSHNSNLKSDESYFVAQGEKNKKKYTIAILIRYNRTKWENLTGNIFIFAKIIEEDNMDTDQVTVTSIDDKIKTEGKKVFNNIHFEFGSSKLTKASHPIINVISQYLKENQDLTYYIVGHTDNIGSLLTNQKLSEDRASTVRSVLIKQHGINPDQVSSHGVGQLSPSVSNTTEEGRAINRRVEIVIK